VRVRDTRERCTHNAPRNALANTTKSPLEAVVGATKKFFRNGAKIARRRRDLRKTAQKSGTHSACRGTANRRGAHTSDGKKAIEIGFDFRLCGDCTRDVFSQRDCHAVGNQ
jgi:hypothetical protein